MKKYRLLKDLPDTKAGAIFELTTENDYYKPVYTIQLPDGGTYTYSRNTVEKNPEWFEEVTE